MYLYVYIYIYIYIFIYIYMNSMGISWRYHQTLPPNIDGSNTKPGFHLIFLLPEKAPKHQRSVEGSVKLQSSFRVHHIKLHFWQMCRCCGFFFMTQIYSNQIESWFSCFNQCFTWSLQWSMSSRKRGLQFEAMLWGDEGREHLQEGRNLQNLTYIALGKLWLIREIPII